MNQTTTVYFCTYSNKKTNGMWCKSREYNTLEALLSAMKDYLEKNPGTTVTFQQRQDYAGQF